MSRCTSLAALTKALQENTDIFGYGEVISVKEILNNGKWFYSFELTFADKERKILNIPMCQESLK